MCKIYKFIEFTSESFEISSNGKVRLESDERQKLINQFLITPSNPARCEGWTQDDTDMHNKAVKKSVNAWKIMRKSSKGTAYFFIQIGKSKTNKAMVYVKNDEFGIDNLFQYQQKRKVEDMLGLLIRKAPASKNEALEYIKNGYGISTRETMDIFETAFENYEAKNIG